MELTRVKFVKQAFNGETSIADSRGIDILGDIVEASEFSINPEYYGFHGIHNTGHVLLSLILDPRQRQGLPPGVMYVKVH